MNQLQEEQLFEERVEKYRKNIEKYRTIFWNRP